MTARVVGQCPPRTTCASEPRAVLKTVPDKNGTTLLRPSSQKACWLCSPVRKSRSWVHQILHNDGRPSDSVSKPASSHRISHGAVYRSYNLVWICSGVPCDVIIAASLVACHPSLDKIAVTGTILRRGWNRLSESPLVGQRSSKNTEF